MPLHHPLTSDEKLKLWLEASYEHTGFWTMRVESELQNGSTMWPLVLNADLDAIEEIGIASISLATLDNTWYLL